MQIRRNRRVGLRSQAFDLRKVSWIWSSRLRNASCAVPSEPEIPDTSAVSPEIFETVKAVEVVENDRLNLFGFGQTQVDSDTPSPVLVDGEAAPMGYAGTPSTEMKAERCLGAAIDLRGPTDPYSLILIVIGPKRALASAGGAIASRCRLRDTLESPFDGAAEAASLDHSSPHDGCGRYSRIHCSRNLSPIRQSTRLS